MKSKVVEVPLPFNALLVECENCGERMMTMRFELKNGVLRFVGLLAEYAACPFCGAKSGEKANNGA